MNLACGNKATVKPSCLLVEHKKFAKHVLRSAGVCLVARDGCILSKRKLKLIVRIMLASCFQIFDDCNRLLPTGFIFQQACSIQNCLRANCPDFIAKDQGPPNSPDLNPLYYHYWGAMLEAYDKLKTNPKTIHELKEVLQVIWDSLDRST